MENKELQLILASALHTSPPAPLHKARVAREAELQAIDTLIPAIEDWNTGTGRRWASLLRSTKTSRLRNYSGLYGR